MRKCLLMFGLCCAVISARAATRLAIVDVGGADKVPATLLDLAVVELGKQPSLALLERADVNRRLREQSINLRTSGAQAVQAGRLWAVDAFLMLELERKTNQQSSALRIRLVDTRYGLKLWDTFWPVETNAPAQAGRLAAAVVARLTKLTCRANEPITVAVSAFRSEEISHRWDWIADSLGTGLEQHLGLLPGVVVLERARTRPLSAERDWADGLPESLRASQLVVDGAYRIRRENGVDTLAVTVRCQRNGQTLLDINLTGSPSELGGLCREVARRVGVVLGETDCTAMDPVVEAEALALEAQAYIIDGSAPERALALAEAASALAPANGRYHLLQLISLTKVFGNTVGPGSAHWLRDPKDRSPLPYYLEAIREAERAQNLVEKLLRNPPSDQVLLGVHGTESDFAIYNWWGGCLGTLASESMVAFEAVADASAREEWVNLRSSLLRLFNACGDAARTKSGYVYAEHLANAHGAIGLCATPAEAIAMTKFTWLECARLFCNDPDRSGIGFSLIPPASFKSRFTGGRWQNDPQADVQYGECLEEMTQNENPVIQATAELALIDRSRLATGPDSYAKAQGHWERLSAVLRKDLLPRYGHAGSGFNIIAFIARSPFLNCRLAADDPGDAALKARYGEPIAEAILQPRAAPLVFEWIDFITDTADNLHRSGNSQRAIQLLETAFEILGNWSNQGVFRARELLREIRRRQTSAVTNATPTSKSAWNITECLTTNSLRQLGVPVTAQWKSLSASGTGWVIFYTDDSGAGIIHVDAQFVPTRHQHYRGALRFRPRPESHFEGAYSACPAVVEQGGDSYVGVLGEGILAFRTNSEPVRWSESTGLPGNHVVALGALNDKLYAIIGATETSSGLVEVDPTTGVGTTLASARSKMPKNEIDGRPLFALLTDESHRRLLILAGGVMDVSYKLVKPCELFSFDPVSLVIDRVALDKSDFHIGCAPGSYMKRSGGGILIGGIVQFVRLSDDLKLISHQQISDLNYAYYPRMAILGDSLACAYRNELLLFKPRAPKPEYLSDQLTGPKWPAGTAIKDVASNGKMLLVLTPDALWRIEPGEPQ